MFDIFGCVLYSTIYQTYDLKGLLTALDAKTGEEKKEKVDIAPRRLHDATGEY